MAERLRIVQACPHFRPHLGGVESHVEDVARELAARGHEVTVLTASEPGAPDREVLDGFTVERLPRMASPVGTPVTPALERRVRELARGPGIDVLHAHSPPPLTAWHAARAARAAGLPFVLTHHCDLDIPRWWGPAAVRVYERTLHRATLAAADAVVVTTRGYAATSRALWRVPEGKVHVVPNPVDAERFHPGLDRAEARRRLDLPARGGIALFVGRLAHHKGIEQFVQAAVHTGDAGGATGASGAAGVLHVVAGDGPMRPALEALAKQLGVTTRVRFLGRVPAERLSWLYTASDVAVLPSVSRLEAFGIAALEAMATARPVVVSDIPGVREVVEPGVTGLVARPLDAEDLGRRVAELAGDPARARAMGEAGRKRVEQAFTRAAVVDALERVVQGVLRRGP